MELVESLLDGSGDREIVELDEEIGGLIQRKALGIGAQRGKVFEAEMKIATGRDGQALSEAGLKFIAARAHPLRIEGIFVAGVRRGDYVSDAFSDGHLRHLDRNFQG